MSERGLTWQEAVMLLALIVMTYGAIFDLLHGGILYLVAIPCIMFTLWAIGHTILTRTDEEQWQIRTESD